MIVLLTRPNVWGERVIRKGPPVFNMIYPADAMRVAQPRSGSCCAWRASARACAPR